MRWPAFLLLTIVSAACGSGEREAAPAKTPSNAAAVPAPITPEPATFPASGPSGEPQLTTSSRGTILSWLEHQDKGVALKFAERTASGWSEPRSVASSDKWFVSWADVPSVLRMSDGTLVANFYPATDPLIEAYDLRLAYSRDEGKTWSRAIAPHHDRTKTQHGFASMFEMPSGGLGLIWLDGRDQELNKTDPEGGSMALYFASFDSSWKQTKEATANARVCECCTTSAVVTDDGVLTAFRDRSAAEIRDIHVSRLENGSWSEATPVHADDWKIDACPVNGPALSARGRRVAAAWFTAKNDKGQAFAAFSSDAGRTWGQPIRLDDQASLGHVDVELLEDSSAVATWVEFGNGRARFKVRRVEPSGMRSEATDVAGKSTGRIVGYPRLARNGDELVFAWTEGTDEGENGQQVRGAVARVPRTTAPE